MAIRIQFRRGTAAEWASANPVLAAGELGYEVDTAAIKIGNGTDTWDLLAYGAVSEQYVADAISSVVGLSPQSLDTLEELALAIGDDPDFINTINNTISTVEANAQSYADSAASGAQANAQSYADTAVSNLVDSSPGTLNTLNELAAALGDDPNFATTIATNISTKMEFVADTSANFTAANALTVANTLYVELDVPGYVRIGDGVTNYNDLAFIAQPYVESYTDLAVSTHDNLTVGVHGITDTANLAYQVDITDVTSAISAHVDATTNIHGILNTENLVYQTDLTAVSDEINTHALVTTNVHGISDSANLAYQADISDISNAVTDHASATTSVHGIPDTSLLALASDISDHNLLTTNVHGIVDTSDLVVSQDLSTAVAAVYTSPTFTGTVALPSDTAIGTVTAAEIATLANATSEIQTQINAKLATTVAASTYAPLASPTFTGTVVLPADTSIDGVSATELSYLNNVSSAIQTQIDAKAPIASPTFTGTVSGVTAAMVGLGDVSNTADADKPISTATQTALDAKAALAGATFTGNVETIDLVVTGNLVVQGDTTTVSTSNLALQDNMIYLNQAGLATVTDAVGDGTNVVYTTDTTHGFSVGYFVTVADVTPSSFDYDSTGAEIIAVTTNTFTIASTVTDTYVSGGTARGKVHSNPDLGWAAGRYDGTYAHAGVFRDASDGVFKFFDGYTPEPDESVFIDTSHVSFHLAPLEVQNVITSGVTTGFVAFTDGTQQNSAGVPSNTSFYEQTADYTVSSSLVDYVLEMNSASPLVVTIPTEAAAAWPIGASMDILQTGAGQVTISPASGVTLNYTPGNKLRTQWSSCTIMKRGADSWILYGDLTA
jgi:hypothetical protein